MTNIKRATTKRAVKATPAAPRSARGGQTRAEIYAEAQRLGITGLSRMSKDDMLAAVTKLKTQRKQARDAKKAAKLVAATPTIAAVTNATRAKPAKPATRRRVNSAGTSAETGAAA